MQLRRLTIAAVTCGVLASAPAAAQAATIELGTPELVGKVAMRVPVTVSCSPLDPSSFLSSQHLIVSARQARGKEIAGGSVMLFGSGSSRLFPCDGSAHALTADVFADAGGPPFHSGRAVLSGSVHVSAFPTGSQSASAGPVEVRVR
jgi:hypothetical protein